MLEPADGEDGGEPVPDLRRRAPRWGFYGFLVLGWGLLLATVGSTATGRYVMSHRSVDISIVTFWLVLTGLAVLSFLGLFLPGRRGWSALSLALLVGVFVFGLLAMNGLEENLRRGNRSSAHPYE